MLAAIGLGELLWSLLVVYLMVMYFIIWFTIVTDVFRSDSSGVTKALWVLAIVFFPVISMVVYLVKNGEAMGRRQKEVFDRNKRATDSYIREVAGGTASELEKAKALLDSGAISNDEFVALKSKILA